jgi:S-methylmethionine-dependent homocysteine/selenocysteine methylase
VRAVATPRRITLLDSGMGKELHRIGAPFRQPEWSALALMEDPDSVRRAHRNFVAAGAQVIITSTYAVVPFHLGAERFAARGGELAALAGRLAREVADAASAPVQVAGSLPPLFGSYAPALFDAAAAPAMYDLLVAAQAPFVDLWLGETLGCCAEAEAVAASLARADVAGERWLSFSLGEELREGRAVLWSGESVSAAAEVAVALGVDAVLFNCATPECIAAGLPELTGALARLGRPLPVGAYANAFPPRPAQYQANEALLGRREDLTPAAYAEHVAAWVDAGATIVGGCCGIHPEHIGALAARFL